MVIRFYLNCSLFEIRIGFCGYIGHPFLLHPIYPFPGFSTLNWIWVNNTLKLTRYPSGGEYLITADTRCGTRGTHLASSSISCSGHCECFRDRQIYDSTQESQTQSEPIPESLCVRSLKRGY